MCIMEVRPGQHHSTITQACAHNADTIVGDLEMFETLLRSHGHTEHSAEIRRVHDDIRASYNDLLRLYADMLSAEVLADSDHLNITKGLSFDSVRDLVEHVVGRDMQHAHTYETR